MIETHTRINSETTEFAQWLKECKTIVENYYKFKFPPLVPHKLVYEENSKFIKVISCRDEDGRSVYAFVACESFQNKALSVVNIGDVSQARLVATTC